jgi:D-galactose 1-dehydrogenase
MAKIVKLGLVGIGKIARDQHLPAIAREPAFALIGAASRNAHDPDLVRYATLDEMLVALPELDAVSLCTPPQGRWALAAAALAAGKHVMIEKPPGATIGEVIALERLAALHGRTLFATWHSREAGCVDAARAWLADKAIRGIHIAWKEDVRVWHPGQEWIFAAGGLGVFDPAINALSILTAIVPGDIVLHEAVLDFPAGRDAPIAATLGMRGEGGAPITADLDFRYEGEPMWDIHFETDRGPLRLSHGGSRLRIGDGAAQQAGNYEYSRLYRRFANLIARGESDVDLRPLQLVADAFLLGRRTTGPAFAF